MLYEVTATVTVEAENVEKALENAGLDISGKNLVALNIEVAESESV